VKGRNQCRTARSFVGAASLRSILAGVDGFHAAEVRGLREQLTEARSIGLQLQRELETTRAVLNGTRDELRRAYAELTARSLSASHPLVRFGDGL
jgi:hypothetical protein